MASPRKHGLKHGAVWARQLLADLEEIGFDRQKLIGNTDIDLSSLDRDEDMVPFEAIAALFERAAFLMDDDLLGLKRGKARDFREGGLVAYLGLSSQNVSDMLFNLSRFTRVFSEAVEIDVSDLEKTGRFTWIYAVPSEIVRTQYVEFGAAATLTDLRRITNVNIVPLSVKFHHNRRQNTAEFDRFFGCKTEFGAPENEIVFKRSTLELKLDTADDKLFNVLAEVANETLEKYKQGGPSFVFQVQRAIARRLAQGTAQSERIARDLGLSVRTLSRRLADENTTFAEVLTGFRAHSAKDYLANTDVQILQIAFLLGYADVSTFTTAFKRWTGQSPAKFRKLALLQQQAS